MPSASCRSRSASPVVHLADHDRPARPHQPGRAARRRRAARDRGRLSGRAHRPVRRTPALRRRHARRHPGRHRGGRYLCGVDGEPQGTRRPRSGSPRSCFCRTDLRHFLVAPVAAVFWTGSGVTRLWWFALLGLLGTIGHYALAWSYRHADASRWAPSNTRRSSGLLGWAWSSSVRFRAGHPGGSGPDRGRCLPGRAYADLREPGSIAAAKASRAS